MKLLLIHPPFHDRIFSTYRTEPLSLETIAGGIQNADIKLLDMRFEKTSLKHTIDCFSPNIVGITGNTVDVPNIKRILKEVKQYNRGIFTIVGGHHATISPSDFNLPFVDAIVLGMGEVTLKELIEAIDTKHDIHEVKGLAFPNPNGLLYSSTRLFPEDLDLLPLPNRELTKKYRHKYKFLGYPICMITTAKGCPFRCKFCSIWNEMSGNYITKSPEKILQELECIPQPLVRFADGNTFGHPKRMEKLYEIIKSNGLKKRFICDIRSDTVVNNVRLLEKWREIGLEYLSIGFESINDDQLADLNKKVTAEQNKKAIQILHSNDIKIIGQFIINQSYDKQDFDELLKFVTDNNIQLTNYTILTPFPGTPLFDEKKAELITDNYEKFDTYHSILPTKLDKKEFYNFYADLFKKTYSLKRYALHHFHRLLSFSKSKKEPRRFISLYLLVVIKLMMLIKQKHYRNAYKSIQFSTVSNSSSNDKILRGNR